MSESNVIRAMPGGIVTRQQQTAMTGLDACITEAIRVAKREGVPQGLIVALMHGHAHAETHCMVSTETHRDG